MSCSIIINNQEFTFEPNALPARIARKLIYALNDAYMRSMSIACAPYQPVENTDRARYITACQLVHDNLFNVEESQEIRNACLERLRA